MVCLWGVELSLKERCIWRPCAFTYHVLQLLQETSRAGRTEQELAKCVVLCLIRSE